MTEFERRRMREEAELEAAIKASLAESTQEGAGGDVAGQEGIVAPRANVSPPPVIPVPSTHAMDEDDEELDDDDVQGAFDFQHEARLYDDEDAQLQAAINASLQEQSALPPEWQLAADPAVVRSAERASVQKEAVPATIQPIKDAAPVHEQAAETEEVDDNESEPEVHELTAEELRQKRLERFK